MRILLLLAFGALCSRADTIYSYAFQGNVSCNSCFYAAPALLSGVQAGDPFTLTFDVDVTTHLVQNVNADFPSDGIDIVSGSSMTTFTYVNYSSPYEYRWDLTLPGNSPYTMNFWFRTTNPGVVIAGIPPTIDSTQFNYLHDFAIYYNYGSGGPSVMDVQLVNAAVPEPGAFGLIAVGLLALGSFRKKL